MQGTENAVEEGREAREEEAGTSARLLYWNATLCLMLSSLACNSNMFLLPLSPTKRAAVWCLLHEVSPLWCLAVTEPQLCSRVTQVSIPPGNVP